MARSSTGWGWTGWEEYRRLLLQSDEFREQPAVRRLRTLPVFLQPASAGTGQWLDDDLAEEMEVDDAVPDQGRVWRAAGGRQYVAALCGWADRLGAQGRAGRER